MTAVEFEIENPEGPETATLVADTSKLQHVLPEMANVDEQMNAMGGGSAGGSSGGGVVGNIKNALGLGGGDDDNEELAEESAQLAQEYAEQLQGALESEDRWDEVRRVAANY